MCRTSLPHRLCHSARPRTSSQSRIAVAVSSVMSRPCHAHEPACEIAWTNWSLQASSPPWGREGSRKSQTSSGTSNTCAAPGGRSRPPRTVSRMFLSEPRRAFVWGLVVIGLGVIMSIGVILVRSASSTIGGFGQPNAPKISHDVIVERLREVAKLVATEMTLRDVVVYEQTRLRSTKRVLLVVTARVSAGINLNATKVELDSADRRITITLPPAQITSVD